MERIQTFENEQRLGIPHTVTEAHYKRAVIGMGFCLSEPPTSINGFCSDALLAVKSSMVHPDTGEIIPAPFRFSAFVPMNMVIVLGMIAPNPSVRERIVMHVVVVLVLICFHRLGRQSFGSLSISHTTSLSITQTETPVTK
jgi:hypothetical protein